MKIALNFEDATWRRQMVAWGIHLITASGAVLGLLAIIAIDNGRWALVFGLAALALIVDGMDGALARRADVRAALPDFDGALLDNLVDYLTYVVVPAYFFYRSDLLPAPWHIVIPCLIVLTSAYQFSQGDAKTADHYFKGFPSYWNVVAFYLFALAPPAWFNLALLLTLVALIFVPIKYIYPSRTKRHARVTALLTIAWAICCSIILWFFPAPPPWLVYISFFYPLFYVGASIHAGRLSAPVRA